VSYESTEAQVQGLLGARSCVASIWRWAAAKSVIAGNLDLFIDASRNEMARWPAVIPARLAPRPLGTALESAARMRSRLALVASQRGFQFLAQPLHCLSQALLFLIQALHLFAQLLVLALRTVQVLLGNILDLSRRTGLAVPFSSTLR